MPVSLLEELTGVVDLPVAALFSLCEVFSPIELVFMRSRQLMIIVVATVNHLYPEHV